MRAGIALGLTLAAIILLARRDHPGTGAEGGDESGDVGMFTELGNILNNGTLSPFGLAALQKFEGFSATPYPDHKGMSIGYGHLIRVGESFASITPDEGAQLLAADVAWAERAVNSAVSVPLTQDQFDALTLLAYNIGESAFKRSTLVRVLNSGDYQGAAAHFDEWNKSRDAAGNLNVDAVLVARRASERELFQSGVLT